MVVNKLINKLMTKNYTTASIVSRKWHPLVSTISMTYVWIILYFLSLQSLEVSSSKRGFNKVQGLDGGRGHIPAQTHLRGHRMFAHASHAWPQSEDCRVEGKHEMLACTKENYSQKQARPWTRFSAPNTWLTWWVKFKKIFFSAAMFYKTNEVQLLEDSN